MALDMAGDLKNFFDTDDFGATGVYTSKVAGESVTVRLMRTPGQDAGRDIGSTNTIQATAEIVAADLPSPAKYGDTVIISGDEWQVIKQTGGDDFVVSVELRRDARRRYGA